VRRTYQGLLVLSAGFVGLTFFFCGSAVEPAAAIVGRWTCQTQDGGTESLGIALLQSGAVAVGLGGCAEGTVFSLVGDTAKSQGCENGELGGGAIAECPLVTCGTLTVSGGTLEGSITIGNPDGGQITVDTLSCRKAAPDAGTSPAPG
jgi:hypothetical protein